jgi:hypothetical protein
MDPPLQPFTLYHSFSSVRSLMVRMTLNLGKQWPNVSEIPVLEKEIDIVHGEQLEESFICDINLAGSVCLSKSLN